MVVKAPLVVAKAPVIVAKIKYKERITLANQVSMHQCNVRTGAKLQ